MTQSQNSSKVSQPSQAEQLARFAHLFPGDVDELGLGSVDIGAFSLTNALEFAIQHINIQEASTGRFIPYSAKNWPFLVDIYRQFHPGAHHIHNVIKKPVQLALTTLGLNVTYYFCGGLKQNALYTLPVQGQLGQFAHNRIDPQIRNSPHLRGLFSNISNVGLKQAGDNAIYLRGMQSTAQLEEVPAGLVVRDELDRMVKENRDQAHDRLQGSPWDWKLDLSHPTHPGEGIDWLYSLSSMGEWQYTCPTCKTTQAITWEGNVDLERGIHVCSNSYCRCDTPREWFWKYGAYYHAEPKNPIKGWAFNQLLSPIRPLYVQMQQWFQAQGNSTLMARFVNGVEGLAYAEEGEKLTEDTVRGLMSGPPMAEYDGVGGALGLDVGAGLHGWLQVGNQLVKTFVVGAWSDVDFYIEKYKPEIIVIDAQPELHKAREYASYWTDKGVLSFVCQRTGGLKENKQVDRPGRIITVNYVDQFDGFFGSTKELVLPVDFPAEGIAHLTAPTRIIKDTATGKIGSWAKGINHYCDAAMYAKEGIELMNLATGLTEVQIGSMTQVSKFRMHERPKRTR